MCVYVYLYMFSNTLWVVKRSWGSVFFCLIHSFKYTRPLKTGSPRRFSVQENRQLKLYFFFSFY